MGIAGLSLAAAAQLTLTSTTLGAGSAVVASCDDAIAVDYTVVGSTVTEVVLTGVADACEGDDYSLTLTNGAATVFTTSSTVAFESGGTSNDQTAIVAVSPAAAVADVTGVAIVIH